MIEVADLEPSGTVWATLHAIDCGGSDVAVTAARADDAGEWDRAAYEACRNALHCEDEVARWKAIARRLMSEAGKRRYATAASRV